MFEAIFVPPIRAVPSQQNLQAAMPPLQRTQVLEGQQQERENGTLFSSLPGAAHPFFTAPDLLATAAGAGPFPAPQAGPGAYSPVGARERLNVPLIETMQTGRETSALLSMVMQPASRVFTAPTPQMTVPLVMSAGGAPRAELTAGEEITTAALSAPPSAASLRVATEAYQMELDAQRQLAQQGSGQSSRWEWYA